MDTKRRIQDILRKYEPPLAPSDIEDITAEILKATEPAEKGLSLITATRK